MSNELVKQISYILYSEPEEDVKINAVIKDETIWLTQKAMAELFDVNVPAISKHLKNIYDENELIEKATVSILETVQNRGVAGCPRRRGRSFAKGELTEFSMKTRGEGYSQRARKCEVSSKAFPSSI